MQTNRTFGIELEIGGLPHGVDPKAVLQNAGINARSASYADKSTSHWRVKPDGSLQASPGCAYPFEIVSRKLAGPEGVEEAVRVVEALEAAGAQVNKTTGMHVHVGAADLDLEGFRSLGMRWAKFEDVIDSFMPQSRRRNMAKYCKSNLGLIPTTNPRNLTPDADYLEALRDRMGQIKAETTLQGIMAKAQPAGRNSKLNFAPYSRQGTVEFRHHSGTANPAKVRAWVEFAVAFVEASAAGKTVTVPSALGRPGKRFRGLMNPLRDAGLPTEARKFLRGRQANFGFNTDSRETTYTATT